MSTPPREFIDLFRKIAISPELSRLYFTLRENGPLTISELARRSDVERTLVYRLLDEIELSGIFEITIDNKRKILSAVEQSGLERLVAKKEQELEDIRKGIESIDALFSKALLREKNTHVVFFRGTEGVKQVLWNETRATGEVLSILPENIQARAGKKFFERWIERCNELNTDFKSIVGDRFLQTHEEWYGDKHAKALLKNWEPRYVDSTVFDISHTTLIYDAVVAYYSWQDNEIFGIEIHNADIADSQRAFFKMLWDRSEKLTGI